MAHKIEVDLDHDSVGRTINALDPVNAQDYVTKFYFEGLRYRMSSTEATTLDTYSSITQLTSASLPVGNYSVRVVAKIQSSLTSRGVGFRLGLGSATLSDLCIDWRLPLGNSLTLNQTVSYTQLLVTDDETTNNIGTANTDFAAVGTGFFSVTVAGTVAVQFRAEVAGSTATAGVGSFLIIERLP